VYIKAFCLEYFTHRVNPIFIGIIALLLIGIPVFYTNTVYLDCDASYDHNYLKQGEVLGFTFWHYIFMAIAVLLALFATVLLLIQLKLRNYNWPQLTFSIGLWLIIIHLGFKNYPFWMLGLQHALHPIASGLYDPKLFLKEVGFLGEVWYLMLLIFYLLSLQVPIFITMMMFLKKITIKDFCKWMFIVLLNTLLFQLTPNYFDWLLD
jgi:hypothetical protein